MTDLTSGVQRTGPHPARDITEMEARAEGHTPTPWIGGTYIDGEVVIRTVALYDRDIIKFPRLPNDRANAAFVLLAVNSYDAMKAALEALEWNAPAMDQSHTCPLCGAFEKYGHVKGCRIDSALSLSRGGTDKKEGA